MEQPQLPEILALATNSFDDWAMRLQEEGVDLDARVQKLIPILIALSEPKCLSVLEHIASHSTELQELMDMGLQAPQIVGAGINVVDDLMGRLQEEGVDIDARLTMVLPLILKLTEPKHLQILSQLADKSEQMKELLDMSLQAPHVFATAMNTFDDLVCRLDAHNIDINERLENTVQIIDILTSSRMLKALKFLHHNVERMVNLGTKIVELENKDARLSTIVEKLTRALAESTEEKLVPVHGVFSVFRILKDQHISKALGFGVGLARAFGRNMSTKQ